MEFNEQLKKHQENALNSMYTNTRYTTTRGNRKGRGRGRMRNRDIQRKVLTFDITAAASHDSTFFLESIGDSTAHITGGGSGYEANADVTFSGGGFSTTMSASGVNNGGSITKLTFGENGAGYTSVPTATIGAPTGGRGRGVTATATILMGVDEAESTINITNGGSGYTSAPKLTFSGGSGTGATASATLTGNSVTGITITAGGSGYTSVPTLKIDPPTTTKFKNTLIEPFIVDTLSDVYLDNLTTFNCVRPTISDNSTFILSIDEFNIHSASNNDKIAFGHCIIPNTASSVGTFVHKGKKLNYICSINPSRLKTLTVNLTTLAGTTILDNDEGKGGRIIGELVIIPRK